MATNFKLNKLTWKDFKHEVHKISKEPGDSDETMYYKYKALLNIRHDQLHVLISEIMGEVAELGISRTIGSRFPEIDFKGESKLTPDIVTIVRAKRLLIIDVTITTSAEGGRASKISKYSSIKSILEKSGYTVSLFAISLNVDTSNIIEEINQLERLGYTVNPLIMQEFQTYHDYCMKQIHRIRPHIPQAFFKDNIEFDFRSEFKDPSEYEHIYKDSDLNSISTDPKMSKDECYEMFMSLYNDSEIFDKLSDKKHSVSEFHRAFEHLEESEPEYFSHPKPSFHFVYMPQEPLPDDCPFDLRIDQKNCYNILKLVSQIPSEDKRLSLCSEILQQLDKILSDERELKLFNTGFYTGSYDGDHFAKSEFHRTNETIAKPNLRRDVFPDMPQHAPVAERGHQIRLKKNARSAEFLKDSGVNFFKNNPGGRVYQSPGSCPPSCAADFDKFMHLLTKKPETQMEIDPLWNKPIGVDSECAMKLKGQFRQDYREFHSLIKKTHALKMSYHTMICADQAMHYASLDTKESSLYFVNSGLTNVMHIFQGGSSLRSKDAGQPFFSVCVTTDKNWINSVWGSFRSYSHSIEGVTYYILITNWRRLQNHKLMVLRDQYSSCQSTGFDTFMRNRSLRGSNTKEYLKFVYIFRTLVSQCTSQRVSEFLMDVRYVVMACYSDYTNVASLISEKFCHHYPNSFCRWIVAQLKSKVGVISEAYSSGSSFVNSMPVFIGKERLQSSLGGNVDFPSLWTDYSLANIQDLFDELFVYVHTGKDPSSNFHEGVKSLNTILKFQTEFDNLERLSKIGKHTFDSFKSFLMTGKLVGCWSDFIHQSCRALSDSVSCKKFLFELDSSTNCEVLSDIESTKSCLPEYELVKDVDYIERFGKTQDDKARLKDKKKREKMRDRLLSEGLDVIGEVKHEKLIFDLIHQGSLIEQRSFTHRAKVHDICHDFILRFPEKSQHVLDVAHWNMFENNNRVDAHICIKAQYGAKREFYVVNFGAKCMVRVFENTFKAIAKQLPQEMISVPGDQKMSHMYTHINDVIKTKKDKEGETFYVNGDCTKWSACETMASFWSMLDGFEDLIGKKRASFCKSVMHAWSNKRIFIPDDVVNGVKFITSKTAYMKDERFISSTQNFMQGMLNYASSVKAVASTEFAIACWEKAYGASRPIIVRHLEHSDDYCLIVRVTERAHFEQFRVMHRLSQKLHGINDSDKKTNSQRFIMEFISLMCFNGQMAYPNIKKTKETGINIAGSGFQNDGMTVISRSGEAVRVGVPQSSCYVVQIIQGINIYRKYSLADGQRNQFASSHDPYNLPIEMFGLPDCLPLVYLGTVGDSNNYRLFKYSAKCLKFFKGLYLMASEQGSESPSNLATDILPTFFSTHYYYKRSGKKIKSIQEKLNWDFEKIEEYKASNPEYSLIKPRSTELYKDWLEAMYYNKSFNAAYSQASRQMINLRLSFFSSGKCIFSFNNPLERLTINEYAAELSTTALKYSELFKDDKLKDLERLIINSDPLLMALYNMLDSCRIIMTEKPPNLPVVGKLPKPFKFLKLENHLGAVIQYHLSNDNFLKDRRYNNGIPSLERDVSKIKEILGEGFLDPTKVLFLNKMLLSQSQRQTTILCYSRQGENTQLDNLISYLEHGLYYNRQYQILSCQEVTLKNPIDGTVLYSRDFMYTENKGNILLENMTLLFYLLKVKFKMEIPEILQILKECRYVDDNLDSLTALQNIVMDLNNPSDVFHKRMFVFLRASLLNDIESLLSFSNNNYSIKHRYLDSLDKALLFDGQVPIEDAVFFTFRSKAYLSCIVNGQILIFCQDTTLTQSFIVYNVAKRLFGRMTQASFEETLETRLSSSVPFLEGFDSTQMYHEKYTYYNKIGNIITKGALMETSYPFIMNYTIKNYKMDRLLNIFARPEIDFKKMAVYTGEVKLFNLPLWPCGNSTVLKFPSFIMPNGVNLNCFNIPKLLYSYIREHEIPFQMSEELAIKLMSNCSTEFDMKRHLPGKIIEKNLPAKFEINLLDELQLGPDSMGIKAKDSSSEDDDHQVFIRDSFKHSAEEPFGLDEGGDDEYYNSDLDGEEEECSDDESQELLQCFSNFASHIRDPEIGNLEIKDMRSRVCEPDFTLEEEDLSSDETLSSDSGNSLENIPVNTSYIQLKKDKDYQYSYSVSHIEDLVDLGKYLVRCWIGYDIRGWVRNPYNVFCIIRMCLEGKNDTMTQTEEILLNYLYTECLEALDTGAMNKEIFHTYPHSYSFDGRILQSRMVKRYRTRDRAKMALSRIPNSWLEGDDGSFFIHYNGGDVADRVRESRINLRLHYRKVWGHLEDMLYDWGIGEIPKI